MSAVAVKREYLQLGAFGKVPTDSLFELSVETANGETLTFYQTRCSISIGGWVYAAAACLAKFVETNEFVVGRQVIDSSHVTKRPVHLRGKRCVELGAGTGVVGIMAAYCGATSFITDLESLVPLIQYNIDRNQTMLDGTASARALCWGCQRSDLSDEFIAPDFLILANCIYYESSLDVLLDTVLAITCHGTAPTVILACYEERTKEIIGLVSRWHAMLKPFYILDDVPTDVLDANFKQDFVRLVIMSPIRPA